MNEKIKRPEITKKQTKMLKKAFTLLKAYYALLNKIRDELREQ